MNGTLTIIPGTRIDVSYFGGFANNLRFVTETNGLWKCASEVDGAIYSIDFANRQLSIPGQKHLKGIMTIKLF